MSGPTLREFIAYAPPSPVMFHARGEGNWYWQFCGRPDCGMLPGTTLRIVLAIAQFVALKFGPNKRDLDHRLIIGDCCPQAGECPGHPPGAHRAGGSAIDLNYYTTGPTNYTQYRPDNKTAIIDIVDGDDYAMLRVNTNFDNQRNGWLLGLLGKAFPERIMVHAAIRTHLTNLTGFRWLADLPIVGDINPEWKHKGHIHVFGCEPDWEARLW